MAAAAQQEAVLRAIGAAFVLLMAGVPAADAQWAMFQRDNLNSGAGDALDADAQVWWTWSTEDQHIEAAPVAGEGVVVIADWAGRVVALDENSGKPLWTYQMAGKIVSTPAISLGWVYVADVKGNLVALDLRDGQEMATAQVGPTRAPITIKEAKLFIGNEEGEMQAFTATTLDLLWAFGVADASEASTYNNVTDVTTCLKTGQHPARPIRTAAAVHAGVVLFGSMNHYVYAVDESGEPDGTTTIQWRHLTGDIVLASPVIAPTSMRAYVAGYDETVRSLSLQPSGAGLDPCIGADLSSHWLFDVPGPIDASKVHSTPAFDGKRLYFGTNGGAIYAIDAGTGKEVWRIQTAGPVLGSPVVANGTVVVGSDDGMVRWLGADNGTVLRQFQADAPVKTGVALLDGTIIVASEDGTVYRLGADPPARPDLAVESFGLEGSITTIMVRNVGAAASDSTIMQVWDNGTLSQTYEIPALDPGDSHEVSHLLIGYSGSVVLEAILDPDGLLLEAGRENNKRSDAVFLVDDEDPIFENQTTAPAPAGGGLLGMAWWIWAAVFGSVLAVSGGAGGFLWWRRRKVGPSLELEEDWEADADDDEGEDVEVTPEAEVDAKVGEPYDAEASTGSGEGSAGWGGDWHDDAADEVPEDDWDDSVDDFEDQDSGSGFGRS